MLLGFWPQTGLLKNQHILLDYLCAAARLVITLRRKHPQPPSLMDWHHKLWGFIIMGGGMDAVKPKDTDEDTYIFTFFSIWYPVLDFISQNPQLLFDQAKDFDVLLF